MAAWRFALVVALHGAVIAGLSAWAPREPDPGHLLRLDVRMLPDRIEEPPRAKSPPVRPARSATTPTASVLALPAEAPASTFQVPPQPVAAPVTAPAPITASPAPAPQAPPVPPPVTPARFDADYLRNPAPAYPPLSRRMREEGRVLVLVQVSPQGTAAGVRIRESSGHPRLDEAALEAVRQWHFVPARRGDEPIAATVVVPVVFRID